MKQTVVEWLAETLRFASKELYAEMYEHIEQAKEMERQQIIDANIAGMEFIPVDPNRYQEDAEEYYNITFNANEK
jgi:hypothetical protein